MFYLLVFIFYLFIFIFIYFILFYFLFYLCLLLEGSRPVVLFQLLAQNRPTPTSKARVVIGSPGLLFFFASPRGDLSFLGSLVASLGFPQSNVQGLLFLSFRPHVKESPLPASLFGFSFLPRVARLLPAGFFIPSQFCIQPTYSPRILALGTSNRLILWSEQHAWTSLT